MRGSGRMSTAANGAPSACSAATVRAEKPHIGCSGVPFMKRITRFSPIASAIASRIGFGVCVGSWGLRLQWQGVDRAAELALEDGVDEPVLLDAAQAGEGARRRRGR